MIYIRTSERRKREAGCLSRQGIMTEENKKLFKSVIFAVLFVVILLASAIWIAFVTEDWFKDAM